MLRNFINTVRRFKAFTLLNLIGLSVAFLAFMAVVMQVYVETNHDSSYKNADRIYVLEHQVSFEKGKWTSIIARPVYDALPSIAPQVEQSAIRSFSTAQFGGERYQFVTESNNMPIFRSSHMRISKSFVDVFGMELVDGLINDGDQNWLIIPQSMANKYYPNGSAVGQTLRVVFDKPNMEWMFNGVNTWTVSAVYRDFPSTSSFPNELYFNVGNDGVGQRSMNHHIYLKLPSAAVASQVNDQISKYTSENDFGGKTRLQPIGELYYAQDRADFGADSVPGVSFNTLMVFLFIALLIVLVACINYINFTTALIPTRMQDINTRKIYGATNFSIRVQLISESIMMCFVSYLIACSVILSFDTLDSVSFVSTRIWVWEQILPVIIPTGLLAIAVGVLAGLYPSLYATSVDTAYVLKGSFALSSRGRILRTVLLGVQYIFSIGLITMAIVMNMQFGVLNRDDMGFDRHNVLTMTLSPKINAMRDSFIADLKSNPGVKDVTYSSAMFFDIKPRTQNMTHKDSLYTFQINWVHSSFSQFFDINVTDGRDFNQSDILKGFNSTWVINERAQKEYDIKIGDMLNGAPVVGVMRDFNYRPLNDQITPLAFSIMGNENLGSNSSVLYVRCQSSDERSVIDFIRTKGRVIDSEWEADIAFMDSRINELYRNESRTVAQINLSSALAIIISLLGIFGLIRFDMYRRRKETALRKINGATIASVLLLFNRRFILLIAVCFVIIAPVTWWAATVWLSDFAYRTPVYWWIFALALFVVLLITTLTVTIQSWKAASENPVNSLKSE